MPRLKRSEKRARQAQTAPAMRPLPPTTELVVEAICPVCGRTIPKQRAIKVGGVTVDRIEYFASIDWDPDKNFGFGFHPTGYGSLKNRQPISPEDAPELFEALKNRFKDAIHEWVNKGWLSVDDLPHDSDTL